MPADDGEDLYELLGVAEDADAAAVTAAWRKVAFATHPDHGGDPQAFARAREAYECLSDPGARAAYDRRRREAAGFAAGGTHDGPGRGTGGPGSRGPGRTGSAAAAGPAGGRDGGDRAAAGEELARVLLAVGRLEARQRAVAHQLARGIGDPGEAAEVARHLAAAYDRVTGLADVLGIDPSALLDTGGTPAAGRTAPAVDEGPGWAWADGHELRLAERNAHGAWVPDRARRRAFHMGPALPYRFLRPDDRVLQVVAPTRGDVDVVRLWARAAAVGPRCLVQGAQVAAPALAALAVLAGAAACRAAGAPVPRPDGATAGTGVLLWVLGAAAAGWWWPVRLGLRAAVVRRGRTGAALAGGVWGAAAACVPLAAGRWWAAVAAPAVAALVWWAWPRAAALADRLRRRGR